MSITHNGSPDQDKDPGPDDRTNPQRCQVPSRQCFLEAMLWVLSIGQNLIDGLGPEEGTAHGWAPGCRLWL